MKTIFRMAVALGLGLAQTPAIEAQSLADVARKEEARRQAIKAPAKVYTNDSLRDPGSPPGTTAPASSPSAQPAAGSPPATAAPPSPSGATPAPAAGGAPAAASPAADEATWRQRMTAARDGLERSQTFAEALQSRINALATDFAARSDPAQRAVISADRQKALAELERVKQEIASYQKAITDTQNDARKAGVPAGWVR